MLKGHGGNVREAALSLGCPESEIVDMSSNLNPVGPPPELLRHLKEKIGAISSLPEVDSENMIKSAGEYYDIHPGRILAGNGTTQFIYMLPLVLNTTKALIIGPTYSDYADSCKMHNVDFAYFLCKETDMFSPGIDDVMEASEGFDTVYICNPDNPTGVFISQNELLALCNGYPDTRFIIDESYLPFVKGGHEKSMMYAGLPNVIVLNSMSKIFRIPGLRTGFMISSHEITGKMTKYMMPWSVNSLAQAAVTYLLNKKQELDIFIENTRNYIEEEKKAVLDRLGTFENVTVFPGETCFMLVKLKDGVTAEKMYDHMLKHKILVRNCSNFTGLSNEFIRFSLNTSEANQKFCDILTDCFNQARG